MLGTATPKERLDTARHRTSPPVAGRGGYINTIFLISLVLLRAIACSTQTSHGQERQNIEGIMRVRFVKHDHVHGPRWKHDIIAPGYAVFIAVGDFQDKRNVALDHLLDLASCHFDLTIATFVDAINSGDHSATAQRFAQRTAKVERDLRARW